ncbi:hypothetical protein [Ideonella sp. B508-1]|uniref:hypothetical protein n=1 Tax=Ideonella sp. B508-1 TaxID=137716 RepID=UPI0011D286E5|nr:hypothetical protein [Ideonella sp. B508-1]
MSDSPEISLDGVTIAHLPHASYIVIPLASGKHRLKLSPSAGEPALWNSGSSFETTADQRYFVAVWHTDQPTPSRFNLPLQVRGALILIPMGGTSSGSNSVTLEQVDEGTALFGLTDLNRVSTQSSSAAESR